MLFLSEEAINYAMAICARKSRYRVIIAATTEEKRNNILRYVAGSREWSPDRIGGGASKFIEWQNGSVMKIVPVSENARGIRAHLVIVDEDADDETIDVVFRRMENLELAERRQRRYEEFDINRLWEGTHANAMWTITIPDDEETEDKFKEEYEPEVIVSEDELMKILGVA